MEAAIAVGYWSGYRGWAPSTVDWCERNYEICSWIAEFWNSVSSLAIVAVGLGGALASHRYGRGELRFVIAYAAITLVGIGSTLFHMTMLRPMQALDELPMIYAAQTMLFCILENDTRLPKYGKKLPLALSVHAIVVTALVSLTDGDLQFYTFQVSFGSLELGTLFLTALSASREHDQRARQLYIKGFMAYIIALACWMSDIQFCETLRKMIPMNPQLHAWWHVLVSCGLYTLTVAGQHARQRVLVAEEKDHEATIEVLCHFIPVAKIKERQ